MIKKGLTTRMKAAQIQRMGRTTIPAYKTFKPKTVFETVLVRSLLNNERMLNNENSIARTANAV